MYKTMTVKIVVLQWTC